MNRDLPLRIIRSTAPLRINDIGGWTDTWFSGKGNVLNIAISPRVEVEIKVFENKNKKGERVLVRAKNYDETFLVHPEKPNYRQHPLLQGAINSLSIPLDYKLDVSIHSRIPAGSSTGTSASVCVALLAALDALTPHRLSSDEIASLAHRVETEKLKLQSGIQDQICAACGGVCFIHMFRYPRAKVTSLDLDERVWKELDQRLSLIYLGKAHRSSALHEEVIAFLEKKGPQFRLIQKMSQLAEQAKDILLNGDIDSFGSVMIENNECQRALHSELISEEADSVIEIARKFHASGWKVNGAGGKGGSLTLLGSKRKDLRVKMLEEINSLGKGIMSIPISLARKGLDVQEEFLS